jgi:hypothetical protein
MALGILARMSPTRLLLPAFVGVLVLGACDLVADPTPSAPATPAVEACGPEEVRGGGIDGRVVDDEGNPLNDILVVLETPDGFTGDTRTGEDGVFTAPDVSGEFQITTTDIDYLEVRRQVTVPCGELVEVELVLAPFDG